jgi:hypothetical protein
MLAPLAGDTLPVSGGWCFVCLGSASFGKLCWLNQAMILFSPFWRPAGLFCCSSMASARSAFCAIRYPQSTLVVLGYGVTLQLGHLLFTAIEGHYHLEVARASCHIQPQPASQPASQLGMSYLPCHLPLGHLVDAAEGLC